MLNSISLIEVGWKDGLSLLKFPAMTGKVGLFPIGGFRGCFSFVDILWNLYAFEHISCFVVSIDLEVPYF